MSSLPNHERGAAKGVVMAASVLMIVSIGLSRIVGLVRMQVFAHSFGATPQTDAYVMAFSLPDLVFLIVGGGVIASAFVPYFTECYARGREDAAWNTFSSLICVVGGALLLLLGLLWAAAPWVVPAIVSKLPEDVRPLCVRLTRIMLFSQFFMFLGGVAMGALNARHHYWAPALGPIIYNVSIILGIVFFSGEVGLYAAAWSVLLGAVAGNLALQVPALRGIGARFAFRWDLRDPGLRRILVFMVPVVFSLSVIHIDTLISRWLATGDKFVGAATCLDNAYRLAMVPVGMFAMGAGVAALPTLAGDVARGELAAYRENLSLALRSVLFLTIPTLGLLGALAHPIVRAIYESGKFTPESTAFTSRLLVCFAAGTVGLAGQQFAPRAFYALNDSRTPFVIGVASVGLHVVLAFGLFPSLGTLGCVVATSVASTAAFIALLVTLRRRMGSLDGRRIAVCVAKVSAASAVASAAAYGVYHVLASEGRSAALSTRLSEAAWPVLTGLGVFTLLVPVLRIEEGMAFAAALLQRSRRGRRRREGGPSG